MITFIFYVWLIGAAFRLGQLNGRGITVVGVVANLHNAALWFVPFLPEWLRSRFNKQ